MNESIFSPRFTRNQRIDQAIEEIERSSWLVNRMLIMPKHEVWIRRDLSAARAAATTSIEGEGLSEEEVKELARRGPGASISENERANINAIHAYEWVDYFSDQLDIPIDELVIRHLNREFMLGAVETLTPGAYRKGQNRVSEYMPPDAGDVPSLMRSFALWLRGEAEINPILKAGIAHIHLVAVHPFWDGNGRTARALATLVMQRSQHHFRKLLSIEKQLSLIRDGYFSAIERTLGTRFSEDYDASRWLEFFTEVLRDNSRALVAVLTDWHRRMEEIYRNMQARGFNHRQAEGVVFAAVTNKLTRADYMEITGASAATATRDLNELVAVGFLKATGKTRSRAYAFSQEHPAPQAQAILEDGQLSLFRGQTGETR